MTREERDKAEKKMREEARRTGRNAEFGGDGGDINFPPDPQADATRKRLGASDLGGTIYLDENSKSVPPHPRGPGDSEYGGDSGDRQYPPDPETDALRKKLGASDPGGNIKLGDSFDPKAHAKKVLASFDPEAYAKKSMGGNTAPPKEPDFLEKLSSGARNALDTAGAFMGGVNKKFMSGGYEAATDALGMTTPEQRAATEAAHPTATALGEGTGMGVGMIAGTPALAGRAAMTGVKALAPALARSAAGRLVQAGVGGALAGGATGAMETGTTEAAKTGAVAGGIGGVVLQGVSEAGRGLSNMIQGNSPLISKYWNTRNQLEVNPSTGKQEVVNAYETNPDLKALAGSKREAGVQDVSDLARNRIVARDTSLMEDAGKKYEAEIQAALAKTPEISPRATMAKLDQMRAANRMGNGEVRNKALAGAIDNTERLLGAQRRPGIGPAQEIVGEDYTETIPPPDRPPVSSSEDLLAARRSLKEASGYGETPVTPEMHASRQMQGAIREPLRRDVPGIGPADEAFAAEKAASNRRRDILFTDEGIAPRGTLDTGGEQDIASSLAERPDLRVTKEKVASSKLKTLGDVTAPGQANKQHLAELAASDPEIRKAMDLILQKKALELTRFGSPQGSQPATKLFGNVPGATLISQQGRAIGSRLAVPAGLEAEMGLNVAENPQALMGLLQVISNAAREKEKQKRKESR